MHLSMILLLSKMPEVTPAEEQRNPCGWRIRLQTYLVDAGSQMHLSTTPPRSEMPEVPPVEEAQNPYAWKTPLQT
jgi:hypothetical protein